MAKVKTKNLAQFLDSFSFMLEAGYPQIEALSSLREYGDKDTKLMASAIQDELMEGKSLSEAFLNYEKLIGKGYYKQVDAAEKSGQTAPALKRIAKQIADGNKTWGKIKTAMMYPGFVFAIAIIASWFLLTYMVPQISEMMTEVTDASLPALTVAVMALSDALVAHGPLIIFIMLCVIALIVWLIKFPLKFPMSKFIVKVPIIGKLIKNNSYATFYQNMYYMLLAGIPTSESLFASLDTIKNLFIAKQINDSILFYVDHGSSLAEALRPVTTIEGLELQSIKIGEQTGQLPMIFQNLAIKKNDESEETLKRLMALMDPLMMLVVGSIVAVIMGACYMPIIAIMG